MPVQSKKQRGRVFTKAELEDRRKNLLQEKYGLIPEGITEDGYYYDAIESLKKIKK